MIQKYYYSRYWQITRSRMKHVHDLLLFSLSFSFSFFFHASKLLTYDCFATVYYESAGFTFIRFHERSNSNWVCRQKANNRQWILFSYCQNFTRAAMRWPAWNGKTCVYDEYRVQRRDTKSYFFGECLHQRFQLCQKRRLPRCAVNKRCWSGGKQFCT